MMSEDSVSSLPMVYSGLKLPKVTVNLTRLPLSMTMLQKATAAAASVCSDSSVSNSPSVNSEPVSPPELPPKHRPDPGKVHVHSDAVDFIAKKKPQPSRPDYTGHVKSRVVPSSSVGRSFDKYSHHTSISNKSTAASTQQSNSLQQPSATMHPSDAGEDRSASGQFFVPLPVSSTFRIPKKRPAPESRKSDGRRHHHSKRDKERQRDSRSSHGSRSSHPYASNDDSSWRHSKTKGGESSSSSSHRRDLSKSDSSRPPPAPKQEEAEAVAPAVKLATEYVQYVAGSIMEVENWLSCNPIGERPNVSGEVTVPKRPPPKAEPVSAYARTHGKGPEDEPTPMSVDVDELVTGISQFREKLDCDSDTICGQLTQLRSQMREEPMAIDDDTTSVVQKKLYVVLDTSVLASDLYTVDEIMRSRSGENDTWQVVLVVPWMVLQELDGLKSDRRDHSGKLREMASKAVRYLHDLFTNCHPQVRGQPSYESIEDVGLNVECNDDRILHCCLLYQKKGAGKLLLFSNDKNLCNKAMVHSIKAHNKETIKDALEKMSPLALSPNKARNKADERMYGRLLREVKSILLGILEVIVKTEMEEVYGEMWLKIIVIQPPWTSVMDILKCLDKHWIAVFGHCVKRNAKVYLDLMIQKLKALREFVNHDNVKSLMIESLQFLSFFEQRSTYNSKLKASVVSVRGFLHQLKGAVVIPPKQQNRMQQQQSWHHGKGPPPEETPLVVGQAQEDLPSILDEDELPLDPILAVQNMFEAVWSSVNHICGSLYDSFGLPNPITYNRPEVLPTPIDSFHFIPRFYPVITEIRDLVQRILRLPLDTPPNDEAYVKLCFKLENYFINLNLGSEHKIREEITPEMLQFYCTTSEKRWRWYRHAHGRIGKLIHELGKASATTLSWAGPD